MKPFEEIVQSGQLKIDEFESFRKSKLLERTKKSQKGALIGGIIVVLSIFVSISSYNGWLMIVGIIIGIIVFFIVRGNARAVLTRSFKQDVLKKLVQSVSPD